MITTDTDTATWRRHLRSGLGLKSRGPLPPPRPFPARGVQQPQPKPTGINAFLAKPAHLVFAWTFGVLMLVAAMYAFYDISNAVGDLEADGNQFAGLAWSALPVRLVVDGVVVAIVAGVVTLIVAAVRAVRS